MSPPNGQLGQVGESRQANLLLLLLRLARKGRRERIMLMLFRKGLGNLVVEVRRRVNGLGRLRGYGIWN